MEDKFEEAIRAVTENESGFEFIKLEVPNLYNERDNYYDDNFSENYISSVELGIFNQFLMDTLVTPDEDAPLSVSNYGSVGNNKFSFGGVFRNDTSWLFNVTWKDLPDNPMSIQTQIYFDRHDRLTCTCIITLEKEINNERLEEIYSEFRKYAFNKSRFKGKCIEVDIKDGVFLGIKEVDLGTVNDNLILTETQSMFMEHFIKRIRRGKTMRVMMNGAPGCGKTETIRNIIHRLTPNATFIIPCFKNISDLTAILSACEVFDGGVIIMDDIDLAIGSRTFGGPTNLLGEFLSFFDGVKKRRISMLASTNDKKLVDDAAERPGRFNFIVDYDHLSKEQVMQISKLHLSEDLLTDEVIKLLTGEIDNKPVKLTGAFIANLGDNIKEMMLDCAEDGEAWTEQMTMNLIKSSYKGFYTSQTTKEQKALGFRQ